MDNKFTLQDSISSLPKKEFQNSEEKYAYVSGDLDVVLEKMVRDGQFNPSVGKTTVSANAGTSLCFLTQELADRYSRETGWKVNIEYVPVISVSVPTYMFKLEFQDSNGIELKDAIINIIGKQGTDVITVKAVAKTNISGSANVNLTEIFAKLGKHPYNMDSFIVEVNSEKFDIEKVDTNYDYLKLSFKLEKPQ